ncbi:MAG UNVERIFIED_CONTAM: hypothetical protein LVT10_02570 [Anaerolineae bacterium]
MAEAWNGSADQRQALVDALLQERTEWPWINGTEATFICTGSRVESAALNLDNLKTDPRSKRWCAWREQIYTTSIMFLLRMIYSII